jgi:translation initiation factor eIF-2B subunit epsilon
MGGDQDNKHEQKLQAVLLADSFLNTFQPITLDKTSPKVLCPLNNVTLLDYSIEFLAGAGVEELFVFCVTGGDAVEAYLEKSTWTSSIKVKCVKDSSVSNAGDALRELDKLNLIQSDPFILMTGDVVTNIDIVPALEQHKLRHKKDSSAIMTVLMKEVGGWTAAQDKNGNYTYHSSAIRSTDDDLIVALNTADPAGTRILSYDSNPSNTGSTHIPTSFFASNAQIELRNDMLDTGIYICSPDVLARFSDEFDFLSISKFIGNSVAEEEEGLQSKIYATVLKSDEYAARIHDPRTYHAVSRDLLKRWCYPIVPDNLPTGYDKIYRYEMQRHMMYVEQKGKEKVGRGTVIRGPGMIGSKSKIDSECSIYRTVIGHSCSIGKNVSISDSHLWQDVTVEDGAIISEAVLCNNCVIKKGATVPKGCVIGQGCVIDENVTLPEFTRVTIFKDVEDDDDYDGFGSDDDSAFSSSSSSSDGSSSSSSKSEVDAKPVPTKFHSSDRADSHIDSHVETDNTVVGKNGKGRVWSPNHDDSNAFEEDSDDDSDDEEESNRRALDTMKAQSIGFDPTDVFHSRMKQQRKNDGLSDDEHEDESQNDNDEGFDQYGFPETNEDMEILPIGRQAGVDVISEMKEMCLLHDIKSDMDNLKIELNTIKFSQNASFSECATGATLAILERLKMTSDISAGKLISTFKAELDHWGGLFEKFCPTIEEEKSVIMAVETAATSGGIIGEVLSREPSFRFILQTLHSEEIVSDEAIFAWANMRRLEDTDDSPCRRLFLQGPTQEFLEWIDQASSDDDSSGSDSDSGSGSDSD